MQSDLRFLAVVYPETGSRSVRSNAPTPQQVSATPTAAERDLPPDGLDR